MTKQEFIEQVAQRSGLSQGEAAKAVDAVLDSLTDALKAGDEVKFTGFGKPLTPADVGRDRAARERLLTSLGRLESARERLERLAIRV